jgi:hypothetical protein
LAVVTAAQGRVGAAAAALGPAVVAARMCGAEGAGKATWRRTARRRQQSGAGAQVETRLWCLVSDLCWRAWHVVEGRSGRKER